MTFLATSVSILGSYAIVGAYGEDQAASGGSTLNGAGSAYIFERGGSGNWTQKQKIVASDRAAGDWFGYSVAISGSYAISGAPPRVQALPQRRGQPISSSLWLLLLPAT